MQRVLHGSVLTGKWPHACCVGAGDDQHRQSSVEK